MLPFPRVVVDDNQTFAVECRMCANSRKVRLEYQYVACEHHAAHIKKSSFFEDIDNTPPTSFL